MPILPPNQFSVLAGASGAGKTMLLLQAWREHEAKRYGFPLSFDPAITRAAIICADRSSDDTHRHIKNLGIKNLEVYGIVDDWTLPTKLIRNNKPQLWIEVLKRIKSKPPLLFIDPLGLFMEGKLIDYSNVAASFIEFNRFAKSRNVTILGVHHTNKARSDVTFYRAQDRASGSGAIAGFSSSQYILLQMGENRKNYDTLTVVHHTAPPEEYELTRKQDGFFAIRELEGKQELTRMMSEMTTPVMKLSTLMSKAAHFGMGADEIREWLLDDPDFSIQGAYVMYNNNQTIKGAK